MGFKIRHNNYRGGFLVARGGGGCNRWPWTNKSLRITTNPNRSSVITVPMEIRFRGDRRMAKRRTRSIHAYSSLFPSLFPSTFSFCFPPVSVASTRIEDRWKRREKGWEGKPGHGYARCFPRPGIRIFSLARETSTLGATRCALVYSKYTPRRNCAASEWRHARVSSETENLFFLSPPPSFFIYLETGLDRFPPTFSKYTHQYARVFYARDKERFICSNRGTRC